MAARSSARLHALAGRLRHLRDGRFRRHLLVAGVRLRDRAGGTARPRPHRRDPGGRPDDRRTSSFGGAPGQPRPAWGDLGGARPIRIDLRHLVRSSLRRRLGLRQPPAFAGAVVGGREHRGGIPLPAVGHPPWALPAAAAQLPAAAGHLHADRRPQRVHGRHRAPALRSAARDGRHRCRHRHGGAGGEPRVAASAAGAPFRDPGAAALHLRVPCVAAAHGRHRLVMAALAWDRAGVTHLRLAGGPAGRAHRAAGGRARDLGRGRGVAAAPPDRGLAGPGQGCPGGARGPLPPLPSAP